MTPLLVTAQAQEMDKAQKDHGSDSSVAPGEPAGLQCPRGNMDRNRPTRARDSWATLQPEHSWTIDVLLLFRLCLLQGIFPTQGLNPGLLHCRQTFYHLNHQGSPHSCP